MNLLRYHFVRLRLAASPRHYPLDEELSSYLSLKQKTILPMAINMKNVLVMVSACFDEEARRASLITFRASSVKSTSESRGSNRFLGGHHQANLSETFGRESTVLPGGSEHATRAKPSQLSTTT
jgi:hypothetical protein